VQLLKWLRQALAASRAADNASLTDRHPCRPWPAELFSALPAPSRQKAPWLPTCQQSCECCAWPAARIPAGRTPAMAAQPAPKVLAWPLVKRPPAAHRCHHVSLYSPCLCRPMTTVNLQQQNLSGTLPPSFGGDGAFPSLINLLLSQNRLSGGAQQLLFLHCCMSRCRTGPGRRGWTCPAGCFSFMSRRHRASSLGRPRLLPQPGAPHPVWQQPDGPAAGA
jgi:hypothetical protein